MSHISWRTCVAHQSSDHTVSCHRTGTRPVTGDQTDACARRRLHSSGRRDAARWLSFKQAEIAAGDWTAPEMARQLFRDYADQWLQDRVLKVRTLELYLGLLRNHLLPSFGDLVMGEINEAAVRRWRKERLEAGKSARRPFGPVTAAKAYRLLHAIFTTAAEQDRIIRRKPCSIEGAAREDSDERDIVPLPVVFTIARQVPVRYRALVLLAMFADLRWGELAGLRRENIDLDACEVRIVETVAELDAGGLRAETPKSRAGRRTVAFPAELVPELRWHLERFAEPGERGYVLSGRKAAGCFGRTSGPSGTRSGPRSVFPAFTSTICDIRAARGPLRPMRP